MSNTARTAHLPAEPIPTRMKRLGAATIVFVAVLLLALPGLTLASPGDLDPTFDGDGMRAFGGLSSDVANAVMVQRDGKLVLAGYGGGNFAVTRLNPEGSFDTGFGDGGMSGADFGGVDSAYAAALQADGKIVVAGHTEVNSDIAVARFHPNGSLDGSFDPGGTDGPGKKTFGHGGFDIANAVLVQPDGKIVVAGAGNAKADFAVTRLNSDGSYDSTFDGDGIAAADFGATDIGYAAALQPDGKIVVAGQTGSAEYDVAITRFNPTGPADATLDRTFNGAGTKRFGYGGFDSARAVLVRPDGKLVVAGHGGPNSDLAVTQLNPDGSFDTGFGDRATAWADFGGRDFGYAAALQPDGKVVVAGERAGVDDDIAIARLQPGGALDATFSVDGRTTVNFGGADAGYALALQADGRIVVAGDTTLGNDFAVARLEGDSPPTGGTGGPTGGTGGPGGGSGGGAGGSVTPRCAGKRATMIGTAGRDTLRGTRGADVIVALDGNDRIRAERGNDRVCGGAGNDNVAGQSGRDWLQGGRGNDRLTGGGGKDSLLGQAGPDALFGGPGNDRLTGGGGRDNCLGGEGRDSTRCDNERGQQ
jgi:uncharacterized delta-60 repeat protein